VDWHDRLKVWNWRNERLVGSRRLAASHVAYTGDGSRLFVVAPQGLGLLEVEDLRPASAWVEMTDRVTDAALGAGDETAVVITAAPNDSVLGYTVTDRWSEVDLRTGEAVRSGRLQLPGAFLVLSPDRSRMAVSGPDGVEVVDLATGASTVSNDRTGAAESEGQLPAFSPDGGLIATSDGPGRVSLWDGRTAELLGTVQPGDSQVQPLFLDEETLFLQYSDGAAYIWNTSEEHALETACRILGGGLDRAQWRAWFGDREYVDVCA
jgi:WD40 repeat protein